MEFNHTYDKSNYRGVLQDFPSQVKEALTLGIDIKLEKPVKQILIIGMGGSGMGGRILQNYLAKVAPKIPVHVLQDYHIPHHLVEDSLVFVSSYSGNTDETLAAYRQIARGKVECVCISSGGKLEQIAPMFQSHYISIPNKDIMPRTATAYSLVPMLVVLMKNGVIPNMRLQMESVVEALQKDIFETYAQNLVEQIGVKTPIIYAPASQASLAYRWKGALNECAKTFAFANVFPELVHNELECYMKGSESLNDFVAVVLKDIQQDGRIIKIMDNFKTVVRQNGGHIIEVVVRSKDPLTYLFSVMYLGDWVSYYMSIAKGIDPTPIDAIEDFKKLR